MRSGVDGCPGALRVHPAADGGLARVRLPGGALDRPRLTALADASRELGDGFLELTSRANVQVRGLADGAERELGARLRAAGLLPSDTHERVRNIVASVLSGRDGGGLLDVRPLVAELDAALRADPGLAELPGRFLFALDDGRGDVIAMRADVGLYATRHDRFALVLAGADSGLRAGPDGAVALALDAARTFLRVRTGEWRVAELPGALPLAGPREDPVPVPAAPRRTPAGRIAQRDGRTAFSALVPLGRLDPAPLRDAEEIIITPWRGVVIPDLTDVPHFPGLVTTPEWEGLTSCAGRPGCARSLTDVRADAARARGPAGGLPVHWSGCERQCGRPADRHVAVVATPGGYEVRLDGTARPGGLTATAAAVATTRRSE
ncbi:precorrin-3B synthase [Actinomadura graeca]|uniref:assimilatory sulfite reductase (ferredoxin) n=1 Tax=Actinomadura graeca TaxID=2750812 RepID=A0ABX8QNQ3_9ACTN|nr:nitrite/sulfite reductase [Actinomadura graeca]QXJ20266.1 precorrin-3B synthase [Actinomadura graeca]